MSKSRLVLSDSSINSYGFKVDMEDIDISRFKKNPVMLYNHGELVGKWVDIELKDGILYGTPEFANTAKAQEVKQLVDDGFINGASIGFHPREVDKTGEVPVVKAKVYECSICDIPSNENALQLFDKRGRKLKDKKFELALNAITTTIEPNSNTDNTDMKLSIQTLEKLGLGENAPANEIELAVGGMVKELADLKAEKKAELSAKTKALLDTAIADGKIVADERKGLETLCVTSEGYDVMKTRLDATQGKIVAASAVIPSNPKDRKDWTLSDWKQKDIVGLLAMKETSPNEYKKLFSNNITIS